SVPARLLDHQQQVSQAGRQPRGCCPPAPGHSGKLLIDRMNKMTTTDQAMRPPLVARLRLWIAKLSADPSRLIGVGLAIVLTYLVLAPIAAVVSNATQLTRMDAARLGGQRG